jgi:putative SOS response-associated peptidase YedK
MPGRVFLTRPIEEVAAALGADPAPVADEPPRRNIAPGQAVVALKPDGLQRMRWGMIPVGRVNARGRPVMETIVNARSETVFDKSAFDGVGRAVLPVDGWYEWTGKAGRKIPWRIRDRDGALLFFAAITDTWIAPGGRAVPQLATVTCAPNADVADIPHRMAVILAPDAVDCWLTGSPESATPLMTPWPEGRLDIARAGEVDWSAH